MTNLESKYLDLAAEFWEKAQVKALDFAYIQEDASPQVRYYSDGSGDPGEQGYNETFAELSIMCENHRLSKLKGLNPLEFKEWLYGQADKMRDSFKMSPERFEDIFQGSIYDVASDFGQLPDDIDHEQSELYIDYIVIDDKKTEMKITVSIVGDLYSY